VPVLRVHTPEIPLTALASFSFFSTTLPTPLPEVNGTKEATIRSEGFSRVNR
jgi:hypothetical protein